MHSPIICLLWAPIRDSSGGYDVTLASSHIGIRNSASRSLCSALADGSAARALMSMQTDPAFRPRVALSSTQPPNRNDDRERVTRRVYSRSVAISADLRSSSIPATQKYSLAVLLSPVISSADDSRGCGG